jgi:hypothetical protein
MRFAVTSSPTSHDRPSPQPPQLRCGRPARGQSRNREPCMPRRRRTAVRRPARRGPYAHPHGCMARHSMRLGAARIRIARPRGRGDRMQALPHAFAEERSKLTDGKARECTLRLRSSRAENQRIEERHRSPRFPSCPVRVGVNLLDPENKNTVSPNRWDAPKWPSSDRNNSRQLPAGLEACLRKARCQNDIGCRTTSSTSFWSSTISVRTSARVSHQRSGSKLE